MSAPEDLDALLDELAASPEDEALRERVALALTHAGRHEQAEAVLGAALVNLAAHDGPTLPCLCRRCFQPGLVEAKAEGAGEAMSFLRRFVVARGRVLWYWAPKEFADDAGLRRSIHQRLDRRLARRGRATHA